MAANKIEIFGPVALGNAAANLIAPAAAGAGAVGYTATADYLLIKHMRLTNKTGVAHNFTLYKGATGGSAAGTELAFQKNVPAQDSVDIYPSNLRLEGANGFLTGLADAAASITFEAEGEVGKV